MAIILRSLFWRKCALEQKFRTDVYHKSITFYKCVNPGENSFVFRVNQPSKMWCFVYIRYTYCILRCKIIHILSIVLFVQNKSISMN